MAIAPALRLDRRTPEEDVAALVDRAGDSGVLTELLPERHAVYAGRSANAVIRMRGYVMAAFERVGLPDAALLYVIEELESGRDAYLVAAAARALRGLDTRERRLVPFLLRAIDNIRDVDDSLTFSAYKPAWPSSSRTTALAEIFSTFAWLGPNAAAAGARLRELADSPSGASLPAISREALAHAIEAVESDGETDDADCCADPMPALDPTEPTLDRVPPVGARFEDQEGRSIGWAEFFVGRPTVVAFFYTRCTNPNKCSLTITKLARLQQALRAAGMDGRLRTAAVTYDPEFDLPPRLRGYGLNRGVTFDDNNRFLRATRSFKAVASYFDLGVSYGPASVNRHRIEAFVLDDQGRIAATFARLQWDVDAVLDRVAALIGSRGRAGPR